MVEDGTKKKRKQGGYRTLPFILSNEVCDKFAITGFNANIVTYLTQQLHLSMLDASNILTNFGGTAGLTPIIGALIADSFAGRFWVITGGSIMYQLGMTILTLSAVIPSLRPPPCSFPSPTCRRASGLQLTFLYLSLLFKSIGTGGIRPCVVAFGADQFDFHSIGGQSWNFFNLYFFTMESAVLLAMTVVVFIQENVSWGWGFGIPTVAMLLAVVAFGIGYPLYVKVKPGGSPMTRVAQVMVAAFKKRKVAKTTDPSLLYENKELDAALSTNGSLLHTNHFRFLDRAAIVTEGDMRDSGQPRLWRLSTVHRVEELKSIIRLIPIWSTGILLVTAGSHIHTFTLQQVRSLDRHLTPKFEIPPASFSVFTIIAKLLSLAFYDRIFVPVARRFTGNPSGITYLQRMGIGLAIAMTANVPAALIETKRKQIAAEHGLLDRPTAPVPMSAFWLLPQYVIHGVGDAFMSVGHMEFLYDQVPESMRSMAAALFSLSSSIGNYLGTVLVTVVHLRTKGKGDWLQDNINRGKLDYYHWLITGILVVNFFYYIICAKYYTPKQLEVTKNPSKVMVEESVAGKVELT